MIKKIFPLFSDLAIYSKSTFIADLLAGLVVGVLLIPQGMAYAVLAGLPPIYGLYGGLVPLFIYAFFGTSRQMSIGPVAISAILVAEGISRLGVEPLSADFVRLAITAGFMIGVVQFLFGLFRLGFFVDFLSRPVISGFTSAAAIIIVSSQLGDLLGFKIPRFSYFYETIVYAIEKIRYANWISIVMCFSSMGIMLFLKKINKKIPGALVVVMLGTLLCYALDLQAYGLPILGDVPKGLPVFQSPDFGYETMLLLLPTVLTVSLMGIVEALGIAKALEAKHDNYTINSNQELLAIGLSKLGGAFFQSLPTSGSFTRSAINNEAGGKTTISSLVTVGLMVLTLLFLTPLFYYLPKAILAAIILLAVKSLFEYKEAIHLWQVHRRDFVLMIITFLATLVFGIEEGVLTGVVLSILSILYKSSRPNIAVLGKVEDRTFYRDINNFEGVKEDKDILIVRLDNQLFFANAGFFKEEIKMLIAEKRNIKCFFLDAKVIHNIDSSGVATLQEIHRFLEKKGIEFYICGAMGRVKILLEKTKLVEEIREEHWFDYLNDGVEHFRNTRK